MTWIRDYVFFEVAGRHPTRKRINVTIVATFVVVGLWHGASWTAVAWGFINGLGYFVPPPLPGRHGVSRIINTFAFMCLVVPIGVVLRVPTLGDVALVWQRLATNFWPAASASQPSMDQILELYWWRVAIIVCLMAFEVAQRNVQDLPRIYAWRPSARYAFYAALAVAFFYRGNFSRIPFVYFQF